MQTVSQVHGDESDFMDSLIPPNKEISKISKKKKRHGSKNHTKVSPDVFGSLPSDDVIITFERSSDDIETFEISSISSRGSGINVKRRLDFDMEKGNQMPTLVEESPKVQMLQNHDVISSTQNLNNTENAITQSAPAREWECSENKSSIDDNSHPEVMRASESLNDFEVAKKKKNKTKKHHKKIIEIPETMEPIQSTQIDNETEVIVSFTKKKRPKNEVIKIPETNDGFETSELPCEKKKKKHSKKSSKAVVSADEDLTNPDNFNLMDETFSSKKRKSSLNCLEIPATSDVEFISVTQNADNTGIGQKVILREGPLDGDNLENKENKRPKKRKSLKKDIVISATSDIEVTQKADNTEIGDQSDINDAKTKDASHGDENGVEIKDNRKRRKSSTKKVEILVSETSETDVTSVTQKAKNIELAENSVIPVPQETNDLEIKENISSKKRKSFSKNKVEIPEATEIIPMAENVNIAEGHLKEKSSKKELVELLYTKDSEVCATTETKKKKPNKKTNKSVVPDNGIEFISLTENEENSEAKKDKSVEISSSENKIAKVPAPYDSDIAIVPQDVNFNCEERAMSPHQKKKKKKSKEPKISTDQPTIKKESKSKKLKNWKKNKRNQLKCLQRALEMKTSTPLPLKKAINYHDYVPINAEQIKESKAKRELKYQCEMEIPTEGEETNHTDNNIVKKKTEKLSKNKRKVCLSLKSTKDTQMKRPSPDKEDQMKELDISGKDSENTQGAEKVIVEKELSKVELKSKTKAKETSNKQLNGPDVIHHKSNESPIVVTPILKIRDVNKKLNSLELPIPKSTGKRTNQNTSKEIPKPPKNTPEANTYSPETDVEKYDDRFDSAKKHVTPLDVVVENILCMPLHFKIADMSCVEDALRRRVPHSVRSFTLVCGPTGNVSACDASLTPLRPASVDAAVCCLSAMDADLHLYLVEANRILVLGGQLIIVEATPRLKSHLKLFTWDIERIGFKIIRLDRHYHGFTCLQFVKIKNPPTKKNPFSTTTRKSARAK